MRPRFSALAAGMAAAWLAYGLVWAALVLPRHRGGLWNAVRFNLALVVPLAAAALLVVPLAAALERRRWSWPSTLAVHTFTAMSFAVADAAALRAIGVVWRVPLISLWNARAAVRDVLAYTLMAAATHAAARGAAARRERERAETLAASAVGRQVEARRWSLRPEVVLATLGRVENLAESDPARADAEVVRLARALRLLLSVPEARAWPLRRELVLLRCLRRLADPASRVALALPRSLRDVPTPRALLCTAADLWPAGGTIRLEVGRVGRDVSVRIAGETAVPRVTVGGLDDQLRILAASGGAAVVRREPDVVVVEWPDSTAVAS